MADGELRLKLDDESQRRLPQAAEARGPSIEADVRQIIAKRLNAPTQSA